MRYFILKKTFYAALIMAGIAAKGYTAEANGANVNFTGNIVDAPCSVSLDTADQTIDMGKNIGADARKSPHSFVLAERIFSIKLEKCQFTTESNLTIMFSPTEGTEYYATGNKNDLGLMKTDSTGPIPGVTLALSAPNGADSYKMDVAYNVSRSFVTPGPNITNVQLDFLATIATYGMVEAGTGEFRSAVNLTVGYL